MREWQRWRSNVSCGVITMVAFIACGAAWAAQEREEPRELVVGETGIVTIQTETRVGNLTLERGRYRLEHRVKDGTHYVKFTLLSTPYRSRRKSRGGEVECRVEPLDTTASRTVIFTVSEPLVDEQTRVLFDRMTRIEVRGENVAHVFPSQKN